MTAYPSWTPAPRPGIIPLHPLSFGTVLGRSFAALRQNPRVLLGFAMVVQVVGFLVIAAVVGAVTFWSLSRLDNVPQNTEAYRQIQAGSIAIIAVVSFALGLVAAALSIIVQGVVLTEVAHAVVAERLRLRGLWQQVRPVAWRLVGYALLVALALLAAVAAVTGIVIAVATMAPIIGIVLTILAVLAAIPIVLWLSTKLQLAPAVIILEHGTIRTAIARSWRLTRTRFWPILGVIVLIQVIFGVVAQVVAIPFSLFGGLIGSLIAPTGDPETTSVITLIVAIALPQIISLLISSVAAVVQATATSLLYIDARMRHEGLDLDLLQYVERRDAGATALPDPYTQHIGRTLVRPPAYPVQYAPAPAGYPQQAPYGQAPYGRAPYGQAPYGQSPAPQAAEPRHPDTRDGEPASPPTADPGPGADRAPTATQWTAPGTSSDDAERP